MGDAQTMTNPVNSPERPTILVVDDEVLVRAMISDELRDQGYTVIEAINADEAVAILHSPIKVDLVVTDMRMPGLMDGAGLVRLLRAELPFVKVLMVSWPAPDDSIRALLDDFLPKPFLPSQLSQRVRALTTVGSEPGDMT
ncbi:MAG: response regulator [Steroidobacter sp.]